MKKELGPLPIVAENLGVITPEVEALRIRHNIPGMVVVQSEVTEQKLELDKVGEDCICYTGTHDNDTTLGWFRGSPDDARSDAEIRADQKDILQATGGAAETISLDVVRMVFSTRASLAIAPIQDFLSLGSEARINTPGKRSNNWRWRVLESQLGDDLCKNTANLVSVSGREPPLSQGHSVRQEQLR